MFPPTAPASSASLNPKAVALTQQLDSLERDLASTEESMLSRLRSPLSRTDPASDLAGRLREQEVATSVLTPTANCRTYRSENHLRKVNLPLTCSLAKDNGWSDLCHYYSSLMSYSDRRLFVFCRLKPFIHFSYSFVLTSV